jgi:hypothetical protein
MRAADDCPLIRFDADCRTQDVSNQSAALITLLIKSSLDDVEKRDAAACRAFANRSKTVRSLSTSRETEAFYAAGPRLRQAVSNTSIFCKIKKTTNNLKRFKNTWQAKVASRSRLIPRLTLNRRSKAELCKIRRLVIFPRPCGIGKAQLKQKTFVHIF